MDSFDNPARGEMAGLQRGTMPIDPAHQTNQALAGQPSTGGEFLAAAATVTAAASVIPLAIQAILVPDASGRVILPAGVSIDDITVSGTDLVIALPNGQVLIIAGGAINIPAIVVDGDTVPASTVAQLLENLGELNPEAGLRSSGGNFADPEGAIGDPYALGDLLPYTELAFPQPEDKDIIPAVPEEEDPTVVIVTPDQPAGSVDAMARVDEAGLPAREGEPAGSNSAANSETVAGSILFDTPDGAGSVTLNGTAITAVGQVFATPFGQLVITSIAPGNIGYSYALADNSDANANPMDVITVVVTDRDGDMATADLTISIIDDVPTARADTDQVAAATFTPETGNVLTGAGTTSGAGGADTQGADGAILTGIRGANSEGFSAPGTVQGQYGTLTIGADGSYSYARNPGTPGGVDDVFTYRLTDGDGDISTATLTIAIADSPSSITFISTNADSTTVEESQLAPRAGETPGSAFDGDAETASGTIDFTARDGVGSVTINGVAITADALPQQIFSDATGTLVISGYSYDPATGQGSIAYIYTLNDNVLSGSGTNVAFDIMVTDRDGDVADGDLTIRIVDDAPTARADADSVTEDGPTVASGNVLTGVGGNDTNTDDGVADTQGADGAIVTAVTGGTVGTAFAAAYGSLTLHADGSYSYALDNANSAVQGLSAGQTLTEIFTYTITDGDGDVSSTTLTIVINGGDDGVTVGGLAVRGGEVIVDEDNLADGSSPDAVALTRPGSFTVSTPDGIGHVTVGGTQVVTNGVFTAGTATSPLGLVNITGFTPTFGADGSVIGGTFTYDYVLADNTLTHNVQGEDNVTDSFAVTVTDSDGSTGNASLDVIIIDDVPGAAADTDSVTEDGGNGDNPATADGNVLTGGGGNDANATDGVKDIEGADGAAVTAVAGGTIGESFSAAYGTLTLNADGSYSYVLDNANSAVQGLSAGQTLTEIFTYTITDGDGDTSPATLTIVINGADDGVTIRGLDAEGSELLVDEDGLPSRVGEAPGSDTNPAHVTDSDSFTVTTPDGMGTVVIDSFNGVPLGAPLTLVVANGTFTPQSVATAYGTLSVTGFTPTLGIDGSVIGGTFTYSYVLSDNRADHPALGQDGRDDSIGIKVTDADGSIATANIDIRIVDDVPTAVVDTATQTVENQPVTIDVLANDVQGADSVQPAAVQLVAGSLTGNGTLVNNGDGSFTYTQAPGESGNVSFQYRIIDGDGDPSVATATITLIRDSAPQIRNPTNVTVDEDGLPGANADNAPLLPGEVTSTGDASADGTIIVDFGSDVPAPLAGSLVLDDSAALDGQLTVGNVAVTFAKDGNDLVGSVGGSEVIRISLTSAAPGPGATEITYGYTVTLSQAIDQAAAGSEDSDLLSGIGFTVTDSDGTMRSGSFGVTIIDDLPTLSVSDTPTSVAEGATVNGTWALDAGADGVTSVNVNFGGTDMALALTPGNSVSIIKPTGTLTVNADGSFSFAATGNQDNDANPAATFTLSAIDRDGDPTSDSLTIAIDDGASPVGGDTLALIVDEAAIDAIGRTPASHDEVDSGTLDFTAGSDTLSDFRFDGVGGLVANLDGAGVDLFWTLSLDGQTITGALTNGGAAAITISLAAPASVAPGATASATVTVTLADHLPHALAMAAQTQGLGTVTVRADDTDGDVATGVVTVQVIDDIPTIGAAAAAANALTVDDSDFAANATANFGFGQPGSLFTAAFNADGPAANNAIVYALGVKSAGVVSGLVDTATDQTVLLTSEAGAIVGRTSTGGDIVFILSVDAAGTVTLDQQRAVFHTPDSGADQPTYLDAADLITLTATITDGDGDPASATAHIGGALTFKDDGPTISNVAGGASVTLDESGGFDSFVSAAPVITADLAYGADGAATTGAVSYGVELSGGGTSVASGLATAVGDFAITLVETSATTIVGRYTDGGGSHDAFTIAIDTDGTLTVTQLVALGHLQDGELALHNDALTLAGLISASVTIKDGDDDTATAKTQIGDQISFLDDGPTANADTKSVIEGAVAAGNVLTDNADSFGTDGADATAPAGGVVGVRAAGGNTTTPVTTGTGTVISTALGDLTLNADGSYSYDAKPNTTSVAVTDSFVYTIRDADGDTSTTTLTITVQPVTLVPDNQTKTVNEAGLDPNQDGDDVAAGTVTGSNPGATTETVTGTLGVTGTGVTYTPQVAEDALGKFVLGADGTYTYTLKSAFDGATLDNDITTENGVRVFHYLATDANGNSVPGTVIIDIIDDIPTARPDTDAVTEDTANVESGNVITGAGTTNAPGSADTSGADGAAVTGVAAGTAAGDVAGGVGALIPGSYGSLTLGADGGYNYTLNNGNAAVQALGVNDPPLTDTFTYTLTDGDGDRTTTTLTIIINGSNDLPTIGSETTAVSDEGLPGGFPDITGTVDTTDAIVRTGTIVASDPDSDALTFSIGAPTTALFSDGLPIVWDTTNPQLLLGKAGGVPIISVAIDNGGHYTVTLSGPIDHPDVTQEDALSLVVPVNVYDGTATVTNLTALTIGLEDDAPIAIAPLAAGLVNAPGSSVYQSLDTDNDVDNNYGGDGPGSVIFTAATIAALQAQNLTSGGQALTYAISAGGTVLTAEKPGGDDVFIIRLQPAGHADQYQVEMVGKLDSPQTVDFDDGGYDFTGGNTSWAGFTVAGDNNSQDLLLTPMTGGVDGGTVNTTNGTGGISDGQSIKAGEAMRVDFVIDLTGSPNSGGSYATPANQNHVFDSHYTANGASALITHSSANSSSSVRLVARDDIDSDNDIGDGVHDTITKVAISFNGVTVIVTANGVYNVGGQNYTVSFSGGEATVTGVVSDTRIAGFTVDGYNSIEFHHAGGDTFKIGDFGAVVQTEDPVNFHVPVVIVDGDGDSAPASLTITTAAPLLVIGSATGDVMGEPTDHVVANPQGQVDGTIQGGAFDDTLVGDPGSVTIAEGQQANIVLVLDSSGSMGDNQIPFGNSTISRQQALEDGVQALIDSLAASGAKDIRITIIDFDADGDNLGTFDLIVNGVVQTQEVADAKQAVEDMSAGGGTNYEDGLQDALSWINGGNDIPGADINTVVFVSDGNPTLWNSGGTGNETVTNIQNAMNQVLGSDGTNEPQQILATGYTIAAIGINVGASPTPGLLDRLSDVEDGVAGAGGGGSATDTTSAEELAAVLQVLGGSTDLAAAGNDVINGGAGGDVIFGDVLYTDTLASNLGVNLSPGSGWAVFQTLEGRPNAELDDPAGNGDDWNRQDTIAYIRANSTVLAQESGRTGGNDTIDAGTGNDVVFGQEGNDTINGGTGDDLISGGTGADILTGGIGIDIFVVNAGESRAVIGGTGNGGTIAGFDRITDFDTGFDILNLQGSPVAAANAVIDGTNSVLTIGGQVVRSHAITSGVITFDDANSFSSALAITTDAQVSAVVDYLQRNDLGPAGTTVAFAAGGRTFIYEQVGTSPSAVNDILVELQGVTIANLTTLIGTRITPVTLDLDGDGLEFVAASAGVAFDYDGDGVREATSWAGRDDGILVRDANGDGIVNNGGEIVFSVGGSTDLEGLRLQYDSNGDGKLSAADAAFASFGVWQDANGNGITDAGEYRSLTDLGIASIALTSDGKPYVAADGEVIVHGEASYTRSDGSTAAVGDVSFITGRPANDIERAAGNQALAGSLVAASLVALAQGAETQGDIAPKFAAKDMPVIAAGDDDAVQRVAIDTPRSALAIDAEAPAAPRAATPADTHSFADDDGADVPAAIDDAPLDDSGWRSEAGSPSDAGGSDALFDMAADRGSPDFGAMDGLLALGAAPIAAVAVGGGAGAHDPAVAAVLADIVEGGAVDQLIDAVTHGAPTLVAVSSAPGFDLAQLLDQQVAPGMAFAARLSMEQEIHGLAAA